MKGGSRRPASPAGFRFLAVCALLCAAAMAPELMRPPPEDTELRRLMAAVIAVLSLVTAEALAFVRPWASRATVALAAAFPIAAIALERNLPDGIADSAPALLFGVIALSIVHHGVSSASRPGNRQNP